MNQNHNSSMQTDTQSLGKIPFYDALKFWFKLGFISFGGPAGQISIMHDELVVNRRWISDKRFMHALNYTMLLPGPEAQQLATYIGWLMHGMRGGIVAGILFVLPSFFILCTLAWLYLVYGELTVVQGILYGVKPAVVAIVLFAAYRIGKNTLKNPLLWFYACSAFICIAVLNIGFPYIVFTAGVSGWVISQVRSDWFDVNEHHLISATDQKAVAIINDQSPVPEHAQFNLVRFIGFIIMGIVACLSLMLILALVFGWQSVFAQMAWFFTKAAMVTFGGAYAVLPYVHQGGVEIHGWLSSTQMIDGLALGETTPGPLIMIVAFVGFVGGWTAEVTASGATVPVAWLCAAIATLFTFLPSFIFILVGGPLVEKTRDDLKFTAPLTAITASVVGVILNLALFFSIHTFWPHGFGQQFEWLAVVLAVAAFIALLKFKIGVIRIITVAAVVGLLYQSLIVI